MVWLCVLGFLQLISGVFTEENRQFYYRFNQNDYKVKIEWSEVARYNKRCWKQFQLVTFKYNRTATAFNLTVSSNWNIGRDLEIITQMYKFSSNEYREFPVRFEINFCAAMTTNLAGLRRSLECGNFTGCPILKNKHVHICNHTPDPSKYPPFIPSGRYKLEYQGLFHDEEVFLIKGYIEIYRPIGFQ